MVVTLRTTQEAELKVAETKMSLGVTKMDRIRKYIRGTAHVRCFGDKAREARLRWFGLAHITGGGIVSILVEGC